MHGDEQPTRTIGQLASEFAATLGADFTNCAPIDWSNVSEAYIEDARITDARRRFHAFVAAFPHLSETDWSRNCFDTNRAAIAKVTGWKYGCLGILASGPTGRGKTRAIADLFRRLACDEGRDVRYYFAGDWFSALQGQLNYGRDDARGWIEVIARRPLVIIDDLGQEATQTSRADWAQAWFFRFLDIRIACGLPLIVSTNLSSAQMADRGTDIRGDPLVRRVMDLCEVVKFR